MELIEILEISERDSKFQTKINVEMIWMDARIDIYNLKDDANLNTMPAMERSSIWVPKLTFNNTKTSLQTVNDGKSIASVRKMGNYTKSPITFADNIYIFKVCISSLLKDLGLLYMEIFKRKLSSRVLLQKCIALT